MAQTTQAATMRCISCDGEDLPATNFLPRLCPCDQNRTTCNECMARTVNGQIEDEDWANIECEGGCGNSLDPANVLAFLPAGEVRDCYDEHLLRDALRAMDEYHDCPNPQCNSGQAHPFEAHPMLRCDNCKRFMCTRHEIPWHDGLTCSEYDTAVADYANSYENQLSQDEINDIAQSCPDCDAPIEKDQGHQCYETDCPSCGNTFCWECLENLDRGSHDPACSLHGNWDWAQPNND